MILIFKGRGILIPVYLIVSIIGIGILAYILSEFIGGVFAQEYNYQIILGIGMIIGGLWTYLVCEDYIIVNGQKEKIYLNNHFFFLNLKTWSYIFFTGGILILITGIVETINKLMIKL